MTIASADQAFKNGLDAPDTTSRCSPTATGPNLRAYYPDASCTAHDKANVRDGHCTLWGAIQFSLTTIAASRVTLMPAVCSPTSWVCGLIELRFPVQLLHWGPLCKGPP